MADLGGESRASLSSAIPRTSPVRANGPLRMVRRGLSCGTELALNSKFGNEWASFMSVSLLR